MAPKASSTPSKSNAPSAAGPSPASIKPQTAISSASSQPQKNTIKHSVPANIRNAQDMQEIVLSVWDNYAEKTEQRTKLLDAFMGFLVVVGAVQFAYCLVVGNYPFNAFLAGFSATVGQFVLTASLRIQTNPENKEDFKGISHERAFADFVFGSMILHFFCVNFIN